MPTMGDAQNFTSFHSEHWFRCFWHNGNVRAFPQHTFAPAFGQICAEPELCLFRSLVGLAILPNCSLHSSAILPCNMVWLIWNSYDYKWTTLLYLQLALFSLPRHSSPGWLMWLNRLDSVWWKNHNILMSFLDGSVLQRYCGEFAYKYRRTLFDARATTMRATLRHNRIERGTSSILWSQAIYDVSRRNRRILIAFYGRACKYVPSHNNNPFGLW